MSIFEAWTQSQWTAFLGLSIAGLSALGLAVIAFRTVRSWTAPATYRAVGHAPAPRPSIVLAEHRVRRSEPRTGELVAAARRITDPMALAHIEPGPGSISSILVEEGAFGPRDDGTEIDPDLIEIFGRWAADRQRDIDTRLGPSMLKAITWAIEGAMAGVDSAAALDAWHSWHTRTETGEWPAVGAVALLC